MTQGYLPEEVDKHKIPERRLILVHEERIENKLDGGRAKHQASRQATIVT